MYVLVIPSVCTLSIVQWWHFESTCDIVYHVSSLLTYLNANTSVTLFHQEMTKCIMYLSIPFTNLHNLYNFLSVNEDSICIMYTHWENSNIQASTSHNLFSHLKVIHHVSFNNAINRPLQSPFNIYKWHHASCITYHHCHHTSNSHPQSLTITISHLQITRITFIKAPVTKPQILTTNNIPHLPCITYHASITQHPTPWSS